MFAHSCTVYNKYQEEWRRTVINGVFFDSVKGVQFGKTGAQAADSALVIIPMGKAGYKPPLEWANAPDGFWTLKGGDRIVKGAASHEITKPSELAGLYDEVYTITSVDRKHYGGGMSHWEVRAK